MLLLSSMDFSNANSKRIILENLPADIKECRILYFPNDKFSRKNLENRSYRDRLKKVGFAKNNIFVFDYDNPEGFDELDINCIYIGGGNTFKTLDMLRRVNADKMIYDYVVNKKVTYIGGSAGAHIISENIEHIKNFDELPDGFEDFGALGIFKGIFICHYSEARKKYYEQAKAEGKYSVYALKDDDCIIVE